MPPAVEAQSLNHWTSQGSPLVYSLFYIFKPIFPLKARDVSLKQSSSPCHVVLSLKSLKLVPKALGREVGLLGFVPGSLSRLMRLGPLFSSWLMSEFQPLEHRMLQSSHSVESGWR